MVVWSSLLRSPSTFQFFSNLHCNLLAAISLQFQLTLGDYFKENQAGAKTAEEATNLLGWLLGHQRVRAIFDEAQALRNHGTVLTYLVANLTRWTTHYTAFRRLLDLKTPIRHAVVLSRNDIIGAQVGAEHNQGKRRKLSDAANSQCDIIESAEFWNQLQTVVDDIEPICYGTNINQSDKTRPDQVLLTFAGIFLHFDRHSDQSVAAGMRKRLEKRWKALDQPMFIFALILNPYERLDRFGDKAGVNVFSLNTLLIDVRGLLRH